MKRADRVRRLAPDSMSIYHPRFIRKETVAEDTQAFFFKKPSGFDFQAGQFITFQLPGDPSIVPKRGRYDFSLASSPRENDLLFVTRMRDTHFKKHLASLKPGDHIQIEGPFGHMVLPENEEKPVVLLAGGIGIAPFRSMVIDSLESKRALHLSLFYANRTQAHAAYIDEFRKRMDTHRNLRFVPVMTQPETGHEPWDGEKGYFHPDLLTRHLDNVAESIYYIVGPVKMVISTKRMVKTMGVPEENILMEVFTGY